MAIHPTPTSWPNGPQKTSALVRIGHSIPFTVKRQEGCHSAWVSSFPIYSIRIVTEHRGLRLRDMNGLGSLLVLRSGGVLTFVFCSCRYHLRPVTSNKSWRAVRTDGRPERQKLSLHERQFCHYPGYSGNVQFSTVSEGKRRHGAFC